MKISLVRIKEDKQTRRKRKTRREEETKKIKDA